MYDSRVKNPLEDKDHIHIHKLCRLDKENELDRRPWSCSVSVPLRSTSGFQRMPWQNISVTIIGMMRLLESMSVKGTKVAIDSSASILIESKWRIHGMDSLEAMKEKSARVTTRIPFRSNQDRGGVHSTESRHLARGCFDQDTEEDRVQNVTVRAFSSTMNVCVENTSCALRHAGLVSDHRRVLVSE